MFESSVQAMDEVTSMLRKWINDTRQYYANRSIIAEQRIKQNNQIIDDKNTEPTERLRALVVNVVESEVLHAETRDLAFLSTILTFVYSVRMFQEDVSYELNFLKAETLAHGSTIEEQKKYAKMQKDLQKMKRIMNKEWKPLMESLKEISDRRRRFLEENR
jgi:hypothetical protein